MPREAALALPSQLINVLNIGGCNRARRFGVNTLQHLKI